MAKCRKCGSSRIEFKREDIGFRKTGSRTKREHRTIGLCRNCGYTWIEKGHLSARKTINSQTTSKQTRSSLQTYNQTPERVITSANISLINEFEGSSIPKLVERTILLNKIGILLLWGALLILIHPTFIVVPLAGSIMIIISHTVGRVSLEYSFDPERDEAHQRRIMAWLLLAGSKHTWQVLTERRNNYRKVTSGASRAIRRMDVVIEKKCPYYIKTNVETIQMLLCNNERLIILPDKVVFVRKWKVSMIDYSALIINVSTVRSIESNYVPSDAHIIKYTWQYVNKDGTPDQRFKDNRRLPLCEYGRVRLLSNSGLNIELQISNIQNARDFAELVK